MDALVIAQAATKVVTETPAAPIALNAIGAGIVTIGAGLGIGKLAAAAMEGMARQPEVAGKIQGAMLIAAALIEGVALFGAVVCFMK
ncbi:MAG: ATP synthase F0 subunit C [Lentisphaeraceae bacterium]|nr:ATP synthase F0 subunit C [Lentisphaeraceae bacterium]